MLDLRARWVGNVFGTNTGKIYLELDAKDTQIKAQLHFMDDNYGLIIYSLTGTFADRLNLSGLTIWDTN